ncbi:interleukin-27 receptor subunit alpha [Rana temporaria]|uniref:interleukin-27 receptor subunit alpha n=1 Tax=Rana temporaria TaxID=8407 RepID=UPI001AADAD7D|nr:interleukin-27 receptor subunit alpha [Rana temporaria]
MSDDPWIKSLVGGLIILIFGITSSTGNIDECSLCCLLQGTSEDLNCTWTNDSRVQLNVYLQRISPHDPPQHYTIPPGQNWLLIPRENLTAHHKYQLSVHGETWMKTLNLTYCHGCENVFIGAPILNLSTYEEEEDTLVVEITWKDTMDFSHPPRVELRYRTLGANDWITVDSDDLEQNSYQMMDLEPYTDYEFQIRYIPDEQQKNRGLWSESSVFTTPEEVPDGAPDVWRHFDQESSLHVTWKPLNHHSARGKILSYNVTYNNNNTHQSIEEPCCNISLPAQSTHVCVSARNSMGHGPQSCVIPLCSVAANKENVDAKAWGDPSGRIAVGWKELMHYGSPVNYTVEWRKDNSSEMDWTRSQIAHQKLVLPGEFSPGVLYHIAIHALYNDCYANFLSIEAYAREEVPLAGPSFSIHVSSSEVFISWDEIPRHHLRGKLKHYTIYVKNETSSQQHTVYGRNFTLKGLSPHGAYTTFITASTAAGEGVPTANQTFQINMGKRIHPLALIAMSLISVGILATAIFIHPFLLALWPKIPKPENKFNGATVSTKFLEPQQTPSNPPIIEIEEMEPVSPPSPPPLPPPAAPPDQFKPITSGYEKHFMPTPEEVMGLC